MKHIRRFIIIKAESGKWEYLTDVIVVIEAYCEEIKEMGIRQLESHMKRKGQYGKGDVKE